MEAASLELSPVINGLHLGQLVEINTARSKGGLALEDEGGQLGQLVDYCAESNEFSVCKLGTGETVTLSPSDLVSASPPLGEDAFDVVLGPRTNRAALGDAIADCLTVKGFCIIRMIHNSAELSSCIDSIAEIEAGGGLGRLGQEVEAGYLGKDGRAKVMWLDPESTDLPEDSLLRKCDANITALAELFQSHSQDVATAALGERTPALVCLSMTDAEEAEFECPVATDEAVEEYFSMWCRAIVRAVHFLGPSSSKATLSVKASAPMPDLEPSFEIAATPGTILLFREDTFEYSYEEPEFGKSCWMQAVFMKDGPQWTMGDLEGDMKVFDTKAEGPPPPTNNHGTLVSINSISIQACGKMNDHNMEWIAYTAGVDGQLEMPLKRFDYRLYYDDEVDNPQGTTFVKHMAVYDGVELFDNRTFEVSNLEGEAMDPQCRQVLEVGYLAIFHVGITKKWCNTHPLHASVSVGCDKQEWLNMPDVPRSVATNNQLAISANRFSYIFNLKGASFVVDTACSSSLIAAHLGKTNLLERRWDPLEWHLGLGVEMNLTIGPFIGRSAAHMASPGGRCFTFNATANGYNVGDGCAAMLLQAGDNEEHRMCFFRGTQIGQDGRSASMSAPNGPAQEKCVWGALREAKMDPPESTTWECHGTGTSLGDPIEVGAVRKVQIKMKRLEPLMIASSKSNFGHLEGGAAAIAMNKCVMVVIKITCAPTQHLKTLNPHLDHAAFDAIFVAEHLPYKYKQGHCQVSSFGVGGANGHAIFWGEGTKQVQDYRAIFFNKIMRAPPPIITDGGDPSSWEFRGLSYTASPDDKYTVVFTRDPVTGDEHINYERALPQEEQETEPEFYSIVSSHNEWEEERMLYGDVRGLYFLEVEMPESGQLDFRILVEGDLERVIGPEHNTSKMTTPIIGPKADITTSWNVVSTPNALVRIEFMCPTSGSSGRFRSVTWFALRSNE